MEDGRLADYLLSALGEGATARRTLEHKKTLSPPDAQPTLRPGRRQDRIEIRLWSSPQERVLV